MTWKQWLGRPVAVLGVVLFGIAPVLVWPWIPVEETISYGGLAVQLAGFVLVFLQLRAGLRQHGRPSLVERIRQWWNAMPGPRGTRMAAGASFIGIGVAAHARFRSGKGDHSHHSRLNALEKNFATLENEVDQVRAELLEKLKQLKETVAAESAARSADTKAMSDRITDVAVGDVTLNLTGLFWFVIGSAWSTFAHLLAVHLH